jgi:outer membrane protein assembly factor BamA
LFPPIKTKQFLFISILLLAGNLLKAQDYLIIENIEIIGDKWTRKYIIEKELDLNEGDTVDLKTMIPRFDDNRNRLLNTGLFNQVEINLTNWDLDTKRATVKVHLQENWFWYPMPIIELADRNLNEWIYQHDASLKRLNLGIRFMHINLSGHSDMLKLLFNTGFTQKYEIDYTFPYLKKNLGAYFNVLYMNYKEIAFQTANNKLVFTRSEEEPLLRRFRTSLGLKYRPSKSLYHATFLEYHKRSITDTISRVMNQEYFNPGENQIEFINFNYHLLYTKVDKKIYPTSGYRFLFDIRKLGFGIFNDLNHLNLTAGVEKHFKINNNFSSGFKIKARKSFEFSKPIPYAYQNGMGYYDDVLSGYQLYVIDGNNFAYLRTFQKILIADLDYELGRLMPFQQFKQLPVNIYLTLHGDIGYVGKTRFSSNNPFDDRILLGAALSLDLVIYENYFLSCELTMNHTGEAGIFFVGWNTFE